MRQNRPRSSSASPISSWGQVTSAGDATWQRQKAALRAQERNGETEAPQGSPGPEGRNHSIHPAEKVEAEPAPTGKLAAEPAPAPEPAAEPVKAPAGKPAAVPVKTTTEAPSGEPAKAPAERLAGKLTG